MTPSAASQSAPVVPVPSVPPSKAASRWGKRLGIVAFLFFLIKGLAWLVVPAAAAYFASR